MLSCSKFECLWDEDEDEEKEGKKGCGPRYVSLFGAEHALFSVCHVLPDYDHLPRQARDGLKKMNARAVSTGHKIDLLEVKERAKDTATQAAAGDSLLSFLVLS